MKKYRVPLAAGGIALLLAVAFYFLAYSPRSDEQAQLETETAELQQRDSQLRAQIAQLEDIKANEGEIRRLLARARQLIPGLHAQPPLLGQLQRAADDAGVQVNQLALEDPTLVLDPAGQPPDTGTPGTALAAIPVTMTVEGGYFQIVDLFRRLESDAERAILVQTLEAAEGDDGFPDLTMTWGGRLFAVLPVEEIGDAAALVEAAPTPSPTPAAATTDTEGSDS